MQTDEITFLCLKDDVKVQAKLADLKKVKVITDMFECCTGLMEDVPLEIDSNNFKEIISYCQYHKMHPKLYENKTDLAYIDEWDKKFMDRFIDNKTAHKALLDLYFYADFFDIEDLMNLISKIIVNWMNECNTAEKFRDKLGI